MTESSHGSPERSAPTGQEALAAPHWITFSVCIYSRSTNDLEGCLTALMQNGPTPSVALELLICSEDPEVSASALERFPDAVVGVVAGANPGAARNFLVKLATGDFLVFLDDDVLVGPDFLARLAESIARHPDADVFGGPNLTPPESSPFQRVAGGVLGSIVGAGGVHRRVASKKAGDADERWFTLCNLAVRRTAMLPFPPELVCAEENVVLAELSRAGSQMWYDPELFVYHRRRPTLRTFASQMFKYGRGRGQAIRRDSRTLRLQHLAPAALLLYAAASPVLFALSRWMLIVWSAYALIVSVAAIGVASRADDVARSPLAALLIAVVHTFYGLGVVWGLVTYRRASRSEARWTDLVSECR